METSFLKSERKVGLSAVGGETHEVVFGVTRTLGWAVGSATGSRHASCGPVGIQADEAETTLLNGAE